MKRSFSLILILLLSIQPITAGITVARSSGISLTGADGIQYVGLSGITLTGADGFLSYRSNGITLTGADGITLTGADGITLTGADGNTYTGANGITLTGADGITLTGADGITLTGADGVTVTDSNGEQYSSDSIILQRPNGITFTGADGITLTGTDGITFTGADGVERTGVSGITLTGADGITLTGADGITLTGADGITLTGADAMTGIGPAGVVFEKASPTGITFTGADGITLTGADGITLTGADGITLTGADGITLTGADGQGVGLQGLDPELAIALNDATDDSSFNAVVVYHRMPTAEDLSQLASIGILGGTRFRRLPMVYVTGTRSQIVAISQLPAVRSIYGNRTLQLNTDPYFEKTGITRARTDVDIIADNGGLAVSGKNVTVAVLDTGLNGLHQDLAGRVAQNVRLADAQSAPLGFVYPQPVEGLVNSDPASGHGTFVGGIIAGSGAASNGRFAGIASGAKLLGLSAGDLSLVHILSGFDYVLDRGAAFNTRVVNCSFSANIPFDLHDPVNVATKQLTDSGVNVVFSAGNSGSGTGTMNPYAAAPWVIGVGATDQAGTLAGFSSRGNFGSELQHPTLVAPGVNVASLRSVGTITGVGGVAGADSSRLTAGELPFYTTGSGTSFSAPQVAGAIALMLEADPDLSPAEIKDILARTATPMPKTFYHEAGAGMLNIHAAVLQAAFPERRMGMLRAQLSRNTVRFVTSTIPPEQAAVVPGEASIRYVAIPSNTVEASFQISWGLGPNDLGLDVIGSDNAVRGRSNYLNLPGITGLKESVTLRDPRPGTYRTVVRHTGGLGTVQQYSAGTNVTTVEMPGLSDLEGLSNELGGYVQTSVVTNLMFPHGNKFRPDSAVTRLDLAETFVRGGFVPQYLFAAPQYLDVRGIGDRNAVESVQGAPGGPIFPDSPAGGRFDPNGAVTRLTAAIALVRAAGLESTVSTAVLPLAITDSSSIPLQWRGHVARALERGFIKLIGTRFEPSHSLKRIELATAANKILAR